MACRKWKTILIISFSFKTHENTTPIFWTHASHKSRPAKTLRPGESRRLIQLSANKFRRINYTKIEQIFYIDIKLTRSAPKKGGKREPPKRAYQRSFFTRQTSRRGNVAIQCLPPRGIILKYRCTSSIFKWTKELKNGNARRVPSGGECGNGS